MEKNRFFLSVCLMGSLLLGACKKNVNQEELPGEAKSNSIEEASSFSGKGSGFVYVMSNASAGNEVIVFNRSANGALSKGNSYATGGKGTGAGLGSQGSVFLQERLGNDLLFVVNAGSNEISSFRTEGSRLTLIDKEPSHGSSPISVTAHGNLLYVVNAGGAGNISGFRISYDGHMSFIPNSTRGLSSDNAGPAQIGFDNLGAELVVTEKNTNKITSYDVHFNGLTSNAESRPAVGTTPFGFAFDNRDRLFISDAFGGAEGQSAVTSFRLNGEGNFSLIDGPKATHQTSACWLVVTNDGKYCYTTNTGSGTISGFRIQGGGLSLLNEDGVTAITGTTPNDVALSSNSKFLYNLNATSHSITFFNVNENGSLHSIGAFNGLPEGAIGIAAK